MHLCILPPIPVCISHKFRYAPSQTWPSPRDLLMVQPVHLKMKATRARCEAWLLKPRAPLRLFASLLSFWSKRQGRQETYYSLYGLCLGVHLPCSLGPQKRALLQRRGPYMVMTARDWSLLAGDREGERHAERKIGEKNACWQLSTGLIEYE